MRKAITQLIAVSFILSSFYFIANLAYAETYPDPFDSGDDGPEMPVYKPEFNPPGDLVVITGNESNTEEPQLFDYAPSISSLGAESLTQEPNAPDAFNDITAEEGELIKQLGDDNPEVSQRAIEEFVKMGIPAAEILIKGGLRSNNPKVVNGAIEALTKIGDPIINDLINVFIRHDNPNEVEGAAISLARIGNPKAFPFLIKESLASDNLKVLQATTEALDRREEFKLIGVLILTKVSLNEDTDISRKAAETLTNNPSLKILAESLHINTEEAITILGDWFKTTFTKGKSGVDSKIDSAEIEPIDVENVKKIIGNWSKEFGNETVIAAFRKNPFDFIAACDQFYSSSPNYFMRQYGYSDGLNDLTVRLNGAMPLTATEIKAVFADILKNNPKKFGDIFTILSDYNLENLTPSIKYLSSLLGDEYVKSAFEKDLKGFMSAMRMIGWPNVGGIGSFKEVVNLSKNGDNRAILALLDLATGYDGPLFVSGKSILMDVVADALGISKEVNIFSTEIAGAFKKLIPQTQMDKKTWQNAAKFALLYAMKVDLLAKDGHYWKIAKEELGALDVKKAIEKGKIQEGYDNGHLDKNNIEALRNSQVKSVNLIHMLAIGFLESTERFHNLEDGVSVAKIHELLNGHSGKGFLEATRSIDAEAANVLIDRESEEFIYSLRIIQGLYRERGELDLIPMGSGEKVFQYWNYAEKDIIVPKYEAFYNAINNFAKQNPKFSFLADNIIREPENKHVAK